MKFGIPIVNYNNFECGICLECDKQIHILTYCKTCKKFIAHEKCFNKYCTHNNTNKCIYCRSNIEKPINEYLFNPSYKISKKNNSYTYTPL